MKKKILINAKYPEEKRVAIVEGDRLADFYVQNLTKEHLRGNIYKGLVVRIEPALQAVFVDFGPKKHGFLQKREIMPDSSDAGTQEKKKRIQDIVSVGQEVIVQIEKDERDTKGASLTTYISLPGRYIVMMPGQNRVGISRKIEDKNDRERLKEHLRCPQTPPENGFYPEDSGNRQNRGRPFERFEIPDKTLGQDTGRGKSVQGTRSYLQGAGHRRQDSKGLPDLGCR